MPSFMTHNVPNFEDYSITRQDDIALIGSYLVNIRSEIQVPDDYSMKSFTTMFIEDDFTVFIQPCVVDTYVDTVTVGTINYNIGASTMTDGTYKFQQSPLCGYSETVTVTNLPVFAYQNLANSDFTIPVSSDLSLIGEYIVTIKSQISVPDDYTQTNFTPMTVQYDFLIRVQPCIVDTYSRVLVAGPLNFNIGVPAKTDGTYSFGENPICDYTETVTVTNLPSFVTHNSGSADFTLNEINDLSLIGEYIVTLRSEICVPNDYTMVTCTTMADEYNVVIKVSACLVNTYTATN